VVIDSFQNKLKTAIAFKKQAFEFSITIILYENQVSDALWVFIVVFLKHPPQTNKQPSHHVPRVLEVFNTTFFLTNKVLLICHLKN
jgi:hypothetical protein